MQVVILAGGLGSRLAEETVRMPKPMVTVGEIPILQHIMNHYAAYGHIDFVIALGYKGDVIKEYFRDLNFKNSDLTIDYANGTINSSNSSVDLNWRVKLVDTGLHTLTGGRLLNLKDVLEDEFMLTYGDGLSSVNLDSLLHHHHKMEKLCTITAVRPPARFGSLLIEDSKVITFSEKNPQDVGWINGGFFCMKKEILEFIENSEMSLEGDPMSKLVEANQLNAFQHEGFWQGMDTIRDREILESLWKSGKAPWIK